MTGQQTAGHLGSTPHLTGTRAEQALTFDTAAFGAPERPRLITPGDRYRRGTEVGRS